MREEINAEHELGLEQKYKTRLFLVRHGESIGNAQRCFLGHTDLDLTEYGYRQAKCTADFLSDIRIDEVYSSSLIRAYNTALPNAALRSLTVKRSDMLREIYAGEWEGMYVADIISAYGTLYTEDWRGSFGTFTVPGGESVTALGERIFGEIKRIAAENEGKTVLIASHAAAIRSFWGRLCGISPEALNDAVPFPINASVSVVYYDGEALIPGAYSYSKHLENLSQ